ncbi:MAG TPA: proton-conducting transporter membrane subunit [bacterium]|nr:proton-conducting transporter membrane subunit [bacterium]
MGTARRHQAILKTVALIGFLAIAAAAALAGPEAGSLLQGPTLFGSPLIFGLTDLSWYFVLMVSGITLLTVFFSIGALRDSGSYPMYYAWLFAKVFGMFGVVLARDLLSFFIMWEIMSWATYFVMQQGREEARTAALGYLVYAIVAGMVLLGGVIMLRQSTGSFDFDVISKAIKGYDLATTVVALVLILVPMLIESAVYPVHGWLPDSYASTETSITAYLSSISTRIGVYGVVFFVFVIFGVKVVDSIGFSSHLNLRSILLVLAALTAVLPTYTALFQHDAKRLVTWHSIGQGGYMLLGLATASTLGTAGGLFHIFNHLTYVSLIVFSIAAVEYRTGTTNLNKLGGLITKQPVAFLGMLFGIIGLAGIPPMNGFVSKWFIYRSLILGGYPFIALAAFIATVGTIMSVYKLIHNMFLGQLPERYDNVKEVGFWMQVPILVLMAVVLVTGVCPGLILQWIAKIQTSLGVIPIAYTLGGVASSAGDLNMMVVTSVFGITFLVGALIFLIGGKRRIVSQYDNYAAGHFLSKDVPYNFNYHFYSAFEHIFNSLYQAEPVKTTERNLGRLVRITGDYIRRFFTGQINTYAAYYVAAIIVVLVVLKGVL